MTEPLSPTPVSSQEIASTRDSGSVEAPPEGPMFRITGETIDVPRAGTQGP